MLSTYYISRIVLSHNIFIVLRSDLIYLTKKIIFDAQYLLYLQTV